MERSSPLAPAPHLSPLPLSLPLAPHLCPSPLTPALRPSHLLLYSGAFQEGYVQQFLYTFRYFCSPHDFLHFLLERISSTLAG